MPSSNTFSTRRKCRWKSAWDLKMSSSIIGKSGRGGRRDSRKSFGNLSWLPNCGLFSKAQFREIAIKGNQLFFTDVNHPRQNGIRQRDFALRGSPRFPIQLSPDLQMNFFQRAQLQSLKLVGNDGRILSL